MICLELKYVYDMSYGFHFSVANKYFKLFLFVVLIEKICFHKIYTHWLESIYLVLYYT